MKLIDSLYHHYYIPPIIFTVFEMHDNEVRRCIDGKQRLTAIRKFIDGEVCTSTINFRPYGANGADIL